ncbi:MAG: prenyltransferase/squalene oxidase repeat-containing protein, partial [Planctomycetota bacterium]
MSETVSHQRVQEGYQRARAELLSARNAAGHWEGELSTSALSTATAVMALEMIRRRRPADDHSLDSYIKQGIHWLATHQNEDGGWGDTIKSISNISTSMLCHAVFHATRNAINFSSITVNAKQYIDRSGGVEALIARYGKDKTFSVPILTHCALARLVKWDTIPALPFELSCLPANFYKAVRLPVVSYALPALIAIGQVRHHFCKPKNPLLRVIRNLSIQKSLKKLISIQPSNGGFLEAAPLTSFVTMSLAGMGLVDHPVVKKGLEFLLASVRPDGSWPIDTNLATWTTTLSVNAIQGTLSEFEKAPIRDWLLQQQYKELHPYTSAEPGGWAWTDLPGGVPDADDTP